jgi:DNA-binding GntR family transcriptional regulator
MQKAAVKRAQAMVGLEGEEPEPQISPEAQIYSRIHRAIAERRLLPGSRLVEDQLAEVFNVSRMRIRSVLQALARDKLVTLHRNRGASVSQPTVKEAKEVFAARRLIEVALARQVVQSIDDKGIRRLKAHVRKEAQSEKARDRAVELWTSHEFHTLLADIVGNGIIVEVLKELMARSALITAIFERPDVTVCSHVTHGHLIELIESRDADALAEAMLAHLNEIESYLALYEKDATPVDLKEVFSAL